MMLLSTDLINDWASKSKPDLLHFIPYTWKLTVLLKEFELLTQSNEYNWVDCSSQNQENGTYLLHHTLVLSWIHLKMLRFIPQHILRSAAICSIFPLTFLSTTFCPLHCRYDSGFRYFISSAVLDSTNWRHLGEKIQSMSESSLNT